MITEYLYKLWDVFYNLLHMVSDLTWGVAGIAAVIISVLLVGSFIYFAIIKPLCKTITVKDKKEKWYWFSIFLMIFFGLFIGFIMIIALWETFGDIGLIIGILIYVGVLLLLYKSSNHEKYEGKS